MASAEILDFDKLLAPISDDAPGGVELKEDASQSSHYYAVKDAREAARAAERALRDFHPESGDGDRKPPEPPDWGKVIDIATDVLANRSKDLWVAAWLIEGLTREHGFAGLRDGFRLVRELAERFWDGIHPAPDEEGYVTTVAQLAGLNGQESEGALLGPIDLIPITSYSSFGALTSVDYRKALDLQRLDPQKRQQLVDEGAIDLDKFQKAVHETSSDFYRDMAEDVAAALDEFDKLGAALDSRCGDDPYGSPAAPPTSAIRHSLEQCAKRIEEVRGWAKEGASSTSSNSEMVAGGTTDVAAGGVAAAGAPAVATAGKVVTREDAFRLLLQVAEFFRKSEPHSPVSYALEQAVRWGRMSLPELMADLIGDSATRDDFFKRVGIPRSSE